MQLRSFLLLGIVACAVASCEKKEVYQPTGPKFNYLTNFVSNITVPAFFVGSDDEISSGCISSSMAPQTTNSASVITTEYSEQSKIEAGVKAALNAKIKKICEGNASLDFSRISGELNTWNVRIFGITYTSVDPATVNPNFASTICKTPKLEWFKNNRRIITGAFRADSIFIESTTSVSDAIKAALDVTATETTGTAEGQAGVSFSKQDLSDGKTRIIARNVYYATKSCKLFAEERSGRKKVVPGQVYKAGDYEISFALLQSQQEQYRLQITPKMGATVEYLAAFGMQEMYAIDEIHLAGVRISRKGTGYEASFSTLLVGPLGKESK